MMTLGFVEAYAKGLGADARMIMDAVLEIAEAGFLREQALGPKPDWK